MNEASTRGAAACFVDRSAAEVSHSIISDNTAPDNSQIYLDRAHSRTPEYPPYYYILSVSHTAVNGGLAGIVTDPASALEWGDGNIDADPLFADTGYWDANETPEDMNDDFWVNGDYHLKSEAGRWDPDTETWVIDEVTSPCIDTGNPCILPEEEPGPNGCKVNIGVYGGTVEASKSTMEPVFPSSYSTYDDWVALGKPCCWAVWPYQCDGDADCTSLGFQGYRVFVNDLNLLAENWKKKIDDPTLDPCADFDHKGSFAFRYRVFVKDLEILVANWKKKDADLPGDCPRPE
jgi:hypothetical protein